MQTGSCLLCGTTASLQESHILPKFVFKWLKRRTGEVGFIRNSDQPNLRVQDGVKEYWLCRSCEQRFSKDETAFATNVFHPFCDGKTKLQHGPELLRFATSISWRVLKYAHGRNPDAPYTVEQLNLLQQAEQCWREFLLGQRNNVGQFTQHILPMGLITDSTVPDLPVNINRFLAGAVTLDIVGSSSMCMTFGKLGPFIVLGHIQARKRDWVGSRVWAQSGQLPAKKYKIPGEFLGLLREKAENIQDAWTNLSPEQADKIDNRIIDMGDAFFDTPQGRAVLADAEMFGPEAVVRKSGP